MDDRTMLQWEADDDTGQVVRIADECRARFEAVAARLRVAPAGGGSA